MNNKIQNDHLTFFKNFFLLTWKMQKIIKLTLRFSMRNFANIWRRKNSAPQVNKWLFPEKECIFLLWKILAFSNKFSVHDVQHLLCNLFKLFLVRSKLYFFYTLSVTQFVFNMIKGNMIANRKWGLVSCNSYMVIIALLVL